MNSNSNPFFNSSYCGDKIRFYQAIRHIQRAIKKLFSPLSFLQSHTIAIIKKNPRSELLPPVIILRLYHTKVIPLNVCAGFMIWNILIDVNI